MNHKNLKTIPYCYLIGWTKINKFYFGVKFGKGSDPNTFWKKYFTSSTLVKKMREEYGNPDIIQIRKVFKIDKYKSINEAQAAAVRYEKEVIRRGKLVEKEYFLNCSSNVDNRTGERIVNHSKMRREVYSGLYFSNKGLQNIKSHNSKFSKEHNPMKRSEVKQKHLNSIAKKLGYDSYLQYVNFVKKNFEDCKTIKETSKITGHSQYTVRHLLKKNFGDEYIYNIRKQGLEDAKRKSHETNKNRDKPDMSGKKNYNAYVWEAISPCGEVHTLFGNRIEFCKSQNIGVSLDPQKPHLRNFWEFKKICKVKDYKS